jgi:hypothetical protein
MREVMMGEPLPLATIWRELAGFLITRPDAVLFGSHAVNAYARPERMTQDVHLLSVDANRLAEDIQRLLSTRFDIAVRIRQVKSHSAPFRVYQLQEPKNRHLVDVRQVPELPPHRKIGGIHVVEPTVLAAMKAVSMTARAGQEKGMTDRVDLNRLLRAFPEIGADVNAVTERLRSTGANEAAIAGWLEAVRAPLTTGDDEDD